MRLPLRSLLALVLLSAAPALFAQDLITNGDFTGGIGGWAYSTTGSGVAQYESFLGSPGGGSLRLQVYGIGSAHAEQCVDVSQLVAIDATVRKFKNAEAGNGTHTFKLVPFDAPLCAGTALEPILLPEDGDNLGGWIRISVSGAPLPAGALSALLSFDATSPDAGSVSYYLMDHAAAGGLNGVFKDGFESN